MNKAVLILLSASAGFILACGIMSTRSSEHPSQSAILSESADQVESAEATLNEPVVEPKSTVQEEEPEKETVDQDKPVPSPPKDNHDEPESLALAKEVISIAKQNYADPKWLASQDLEHAMLDGMIKSMRGTVKWVGQQDADREATPAFSVVEVVDDAVIYARLNHLEKDTGSKLTRELIELRNHQPLKGVILDLRFRNDQAYENISEFVSHFVDRKVKLFSIQRKAGTLDVQSTPAEPRLDCPLILLINQETSGSMEVLAKVFQQTGRAVLVGNASTASQMFDTTDFELKNGNKIRLATGKILFPGEKDSFLKPVNPDVKVVFDPELENRIFHLPFERPDVHGGTRYYSEAILTGKEQAPPLRPDEKKSQHVPLTNKDISLLTAVDLLKGIHSLGSLN